MDNQTAEPTTSSQTVFSDPKNIFLFALLLIVVLLFIGINIITTTGHILENILSIFKPFVLSILGLFGYTTGSVINKSADVVTDVGRFGLEIAEGSVQSVGGLLKKASAPYVNDFTKKSLDSVLTPTRDYAYVAEDEKRKKKEGFDLSTMVQIQIPISSNKRSWCLPEENAMIRTSVPVEDADKAPSGQTFPQQMKCMKQ